MPRIGSYFVHTLNPPCLSRKCFLPSIDIQINALPAKSHWVCGLKTYWFRSFYVEEQWTQSNQDNPEEKILSGDTSPTDLFEALMRC